LDEVDRTAWEGRRQISGLLLVLSKYCSFVG